MNNNFLLEIKIPIDVGAIDWVGELPDVITPHKIGLDDGRFYVFGYFVSFEDDHTERDLFKIICQHGFGPLVNSNSQFLLFRFDRKTETLVVCTDQFLKLPCYFAQVNHSLILSGSFGQIKEFIKARKTLTVNIDKALSYLLREFHNTDSTLVEQIKIIPGGSLVEFNLNQLSKYRLRSLINPDSFYGSIPSPRSDSLEAFSTEWLSLLIELVRRRCHTIPSGTKIGCDVSSGFDCALIAYSLSQILPPGSFTGYTNYSQIMGDENNLGVVNRFARRHHFPLKTVDYTEQSRHETELSSGWADDPLHPFYFVHHRPYVKFLGDHGVRIQFSGDYGDEAYDMKQMELFSRFPIQQSFFKSVRAFRKKVDTNTFTKRARDLFLDWGRFQQRGRYPLIVPENSVSYQPLIEGYGEKGISLLHVFNDTRLLALSAQAPLPEGSGSDRLKELLTPYFRSIMPENYYASSNACEPFIYFFRNQKVFANSVIANSRLAELNLTNPGYILKLINNPQSEIYTNKNYQRAVQVYELLKLDWYLQKNNIF